MGFNGAAGASADQTSAIQEVIQEANNFVQNQASPAPQGNTESTWELTGDAPSGGFISYSNLSGTTALAEPERSWVVNGQVQLLSTAEANSMIREKTAEINEVFTGGLADRLQAGMTALVNAETSNIGALGSPGGSTVVGWEALDVSGSTATVQCLEDEWLQVDTVTPATASSPATVSSEMALGENEEYVTLQQAPGGLWQVSSLDVVPLGPTG
ncbi:MAG: hypothetical protein ABSA14_14595 [Acidimicrobiales bacterium]